MASPFKDFHPHPGQQTRFLQSPAFEALFGGAAGPGKSLCLLMEAARQVSNPKYNALLLRRTFGRLEAADGLIQRSLRYFPTFGGKYNGSKHVWTFPSGAKIYFGHLQNPGDEQQYQGAQYAFIGCDELTEFLETQYMYLFSRCRTDIDSGLRCYIRAATNPGNVGHNWVKRRFVTRDIVNKTRHFALIVDEHGTEIDTAVSRDYPDCKSRAFYPATFKDNPSLDPTYKATLNQMTDPVKRAYLLLGDWDAVSLEGRVYPNWSTDNISSEAEYNPAWGDVYWSVDDGYQNPRVILFWQLHPDGRAFCFDEIYESHKLSDAHIEQALAKAYPQPEVVYYDPSAVQFAAECWEHDLFTASADNRVQEGVKQVRDYIRDGQGVVSMLIHPRCVKVIEEIPGLRYDVARTPQGGDPPIVKEDDHAADALRYFIQTACSPLPGGRR